MFPCLHIKINLKFSFVFVLKINVNCSLVFVLKINLKISLVLVLRIKKGNFILYTPL